MINVTFKEPFYMVQDGLMCEVLKLECKSIEVDNETHFCKLSNNVLTINLDFANWVKEIKI